MKKGTIISVLALSVAAIACQREQTDLDTPFRAGDELTFTARIEGGTRTSLEGTKIMWNAGESINIFYGASETGSHFVSSNTESSQSVSFSGTISAFTGTTGDGEPLSFWAVYPYNEDDSCTGSAVSANLPATQFGVENNIPDEAMMMVAKTPGLALSFKQVCSRLRLKISHPDITKIVFCGNAGEVVAGRATIAMDGNGNPVWTAENGATEIELIPDVDHFVNGSEYYLVLYPQNFEDGITIKYYRDESYGELYYDAPIEFERNGRNTFNSSEVEVWESTAEPEVVDLGLPSGTLWATCNLGATTPEAVGNYYAWGELTPRTGNYGTANATIKAKYQDSALTQLEPEDDAAYYLWGGDWRLPTQTQMQELKTECTWSMVTSNGVDVYCVVGPNGNSIYIPVTGSIRSGTTPNFVGQSPVCLWSSSKTTDDPKAVVMTLSYNPETTVVTRSVFGYSGIGEGVPIRPVRPKTHIAGHEFVEMGDGLKWATCNVGADNPWDYGNYYAWGEITPKSSYILDNYFDKVYLKYAPDKSTRLWVTDDAARCNWGGDWRMPTYSEWSELNDRSHYNWSWTDDYNGTGVKGMIVTSQREGYEGNTIFLPAAGYKYGEEGSVGYEGRRGYYWSSDLWSTYESAQDLYFYYVSSPSVYMGHDDRYKGFSVRPVCD